MGSSPPVDAARQGGGEGDRRGRIGQDAGISELICQPRIACHASTAWKVSRAVL